jgi:hypothetical protein
MRFATATSELDRLADALRRADATWRGAETFEVWDELSESQQKRWRATARRAATAVFEEIPHRSPRRIS